MFPNSIEWKPRRDTVITADEVMDWKIDVETKIRTVEDLLRHPLFANMVRM